MSTPRHTLAIHMMGFIYQVVMMMPQSLDEVQPR